MSRSIWLEERWWRAFYSKDFSLEVIVRGGFSPGMADANEHSKKISDGIRILIDWEFSIELLFCIQKHPCRTDLEG